MLSICYLYLGVHFLTACVDCPPQLQEVEDVVVAAVVDGVLVVQWPALAVGDKTTLQATHTSPPHLLTCRQCNCPV